MSSGLIKTGEARIKLNGPLACNLRISAYKRYEKNRKWGIAITKDGATLNMGRASHKQMEAQESEQFDVVGIDLEHSEVVVFHYYDPETKEHIIPSKELLDEFKQLADAATRLPSMQDLQSRKSN